MLPRSYIYEDINRTNCGNNDKIHLVKAGNVLLNVALFVERASQNEDEFALELMISAEDGNHWIAHRIFKPKELLANVWNPMAQSLGGFLGVKLFSYNGIGNEDYDLCVTEYALPMNTVSIG